MGVGEIIQVVLVDLTTGPSDDVGELAVSTLDVLGDQVTGAVVAV